MPQSREFQPGLNESSGSPLQFSEKLFNLPAEVDEGSRQFYLNLKGQIAPARRVLQTFGSQQGHYTRLCSCAKVVRNYTIAPMQSPSLDNERHIYGSSSVSSQ